MSAQETRDPSTPNPDNVRILYEAIIDWMISKGMTTLEASPAESVGSESASAPVPAQ